MTAALWILAAALLALGWGWYSSALVITTDRDFVDKSPADFGVPYQIVNFRSEDGTALAGWFVPSASWSDVTLFLCHGFGACRANILPRTIFLNRRGGYNLFYLDFRNHGDSGGEASSLSKRESEDLAAAVRFVRENWPERSKRLGFFGSSMGGSVVLTTAAKMKDVLAAAAESPFSDFNDTVARYGRLFHNVPRFIAPYTLFFVRKRLGFDPEEFSPIHHIQGIAPRPVFLIQGDSDARMPVSEGNSLFAAAGEPKELWTVPGADHGEAAAAAGTLYEERLLEFYKKAFGGAAS